jgi:hypothetical protein
MSIAIQLALFGALVIVALLLLWQALAIQKKWAVDGEVRDQGKRRLIRNLVLGGASILVMIWLQIFYVFNPPPTHIDRGPSPQTQR